MADNFGNDEIFDWMANAPDKSDDAKPKGKRGRKSHAEKMAAAKAELEAKRAAAREKQKAESEWKSPLTAEQLEQWHSIDNEFWWR